MRLCGYRVMRFYGYEVLRLCGYKGMSDGLLLQHFTVNGIRITIKLHYRKTAKP